MREAQLRSLVTRLVNESFTGDDGDVAAAILDPDDSGFGPLCFELHREGNGDTEQITALWKKVAANLVDTDKLDAIADGFFDSPGAYLSTLVGKV